MGKEFSLKQNQALHFKQSQLLMMMPQMQQGIAFLQAPVMEMVSLIELEMEKNPLLEYLDETELAEEQKKEQDKNDKEQEVNFDEDDFEILKRLDEEYRDFFRESGSFQKISEEELKRRAHAENSIQSEINLYEHLIIQVRECFEEDEEQKIAEAILSDLDERGFIQSTIGEIAAILETSPQSIENVLKRIQTFDPFGVGSRTIQESLLIQLKMLGKKDTLAYQIAKDHFDDLIHNRMPAIHKSLKAPHEEIRRVIEEEIATLDLQPGLWYSQKQSNYIIPDIYVEQEGSNLFIHIEDDPLPMLRINRRYLNLIQDPSLSEEDKNYIKNHVISAKWLIKNIYQRQDTLKKITDYIISKQHDYLADKEGQLIPMTMSEIAEHLEMHESTIARAVSNKYISCPKGIISLRSFFTSSLNTDQGEEISSDTVRNALQEIIDVEDKKKPLSDEKLSQLLKERGIHCARRTITKYRSLLKIGNAHQRRIY